MAKEYKPYWEKLRDPRWQKKRLEIMQRDEFHCVDCGTDLETLNVHHDYYEKNKDPWEYPSESLHTVCETCHETRTTTRAQLDRVLSVLSPSHYQIENVLGFAFGTAIFLKTDVTIYATEWAMYGLWDGLRRQLCGDEEAPFSVVDYIMKGGDISTAEIRRLWSQDGDLPRIAT
jgi:hypothetical protein